MTVEAVLVKPDQGAQLFSAGTLKAGPTKVVPPLPKPPAVAIQKVDLRQESSGRGRRGWIRWCSRRENSVSVAATTPAVAKRFSVPFGVPVLLPVGSTCHSKRGCTAALLEELKAEEYILMICESKDFDEVAVPVAREHQNAANNEGSIDGQGTIDGQSCIRRGRADAHIRTNVVVNNRVHDGACSGKFGYLVGGASGGGHCRCNIGGNGGLTSERKMDSRRLKPENCKEFLGLASDG